jgi:hypothetical protein
MWAKLDDALLDHPKILIASRAFGRNGRAAALGFYAAGLLYTNKQLTDGFLPTAVVERMGFADKPLAAADAMVKAGLWDAVSGGFQVHDFHDFNPAARDVHEKRKRDRERKQKGGRNSRHNGSRS